MSDVAQPNDQPAVNGVSHVDQLVALFAPDAEITFTVPPGKYRGREEIRKLLEALAPLSVLQARVEQLDGSPQILTLSLGPPAASTSDTASDETSPAEATPAAASPETKKEDGDRTRGSIRRFFGPNAQILGAALLSFATAISTMIGALVIFFPDLSREPPAALGATLGEVALEERAVPTANGLANLISYEVEFVGYKKKRGYIKYAIFDARTGRRIDPPLSTDPEAPHYYPVGPVIPEAPNDRASANFPVPIPRQAQCIFVRVYAFEEDDAVTRLDYADTPPFDTHSATNRACADLAAGSQAD